MSAPSRGGHISAECDDGHFIARLWKVDWTLNARATRQRTLSSHSVSFIKEINALSFPNCCQTSICRYCVYPTGPKTKPQPAQPGHHKGELHRAHWPHTTTQIVWRMGGLVHNLPDCSCCRMVLYLSKHAMRHSKVRPSLKPFTARFPQWKL